MRFYTNENFYLSAVNVLRELGHDVLTYYKAGQANRSIPDHEVLRFAMENQRILVTLNRRDFIRLHANNPTHSGIIVCTEDSDPRSLANRIDLTIRAIEGDMKGKLIRIVRV